MALISGCTQLSQLGTEDVVLPESPPLEASELKHVAESCRKSVDALEKRSAYVPKERRSEFNTVVGIAADNCSDLEETLKRLKQATHQKNAYAQNLQHAESTIIQHGTKANGISEVSLSDFSEFEQDDSSEFDSKPLQ